MLDDVLLKKIGIYQYGVIPTHKIKFYDEIRKICENNGCGCYGTTWACPPAVGSIEQCQRKCLSYDNAMVFSAKYDLEDSYDFDGMRKGHKDFKDLCDRLHIAVKSNYPNHLLLSNESCLRCEKCTYPESGCRMSDVLFPALEGFCVNVSELASLSNVCYINGENTVTYFGMLLF